VTALIELALCWSILSSCCVCCRSDFMSVPFQAIECYMSGVIPLHGKPSWAPDE